MATIKAEVADGSRIAVMSDIHIPHHDADAIKLLIEAYEREGVTHVALLGDIADCGVSSRHDGKRQRDTIDLGTLKKSVQRGRWIYDWARTRTCWLFRGNHERWVEDRIAQDASLTDAVTPESLMGLPETGWTVIPSDGRLRIGSLVLEHGHGIFPSGSGGQSPGNRIRQVAPNQTTLIGHLHREFTAVWSVRDGDGRDKSYAAIGQGHLSIEAMHSHYAGGYPGWQQSGSLIRIWYADGAPRFTVDSLRIHRDRRNRPLLEYGGKVYR